MCLLRARLVPALVLLLVTSTAAAAQGVELTIFVGRSYPIYDERLRFTPATPALPGISVTEVGTLEIAAEGGPVFGGALAFELGILGIEGRLDSTDVGLRLTGARYDLVATEPPFLGATGSLTIGSGPFDVDRLNLLSVNGRLRTPGATGVFVSGGLSYLPSITVSGAVPMTLEVAGITPPIGFQPELRLIAEPDEPDHRWGLNAGAGLRVGSERLALVIEGRVFRFREFDLRFAADNAPDLVNALLDSIATVRFRPTVWNAQVGLAIKF